MDCPGGEWRESPEGVVECPGGPALCGQGSLAGHREQAGFPSSPGSEGLREVWVEAAGAQPRDLNGRHGRQAQCSTRMPLCPFWAVGRFRAAVD